VKAVARQGAGELYPIFRVCRLYRHARHVLRHLDDAVVIILNLSCV